MSNATDWSGRIEEARRVERDWRTKGREVIDIYRAEKTADGGSGRGRFNMLYANTSILAPAMYQQPPRADVRRRFSRANPVADRAAAILQAALNASFETGGLDSEVKRMVQDVLLPGRAVLRVRWVPVVQELLSTGPDGVPLKEVRKVWETLEYDHVFWEDFICEPARRWKEVNWCAFRHYLTRQQMREEFGDSEDIARLLDDGEWSRAAFVHSPSDTEQLSNTCKSAEPRAIVWECWDKTGRVIDWIVPGISSQLLRRDEDVLQLQGFFPCAEPLTSVSTSNTMVPVPEYEIYRDLAAEVARLTERIDAIMKRMRIRGLFNGSIEELADALDGEDGKMVAVASVEMEALASNIWLIPLDMLAQTAMALYGAREQSKQALYEVTGISDVLRGASVAGETATAQRIKGNFGTLRIDDRRRALNGTIQQVNRIAAEIMASKFSAQTLSMMSGYELTQDVEAFLRNEAMLMCHVDVETDSTIAADEFGEQETATRLVQAVGGILQTFAPLVQAGFAPPEFVAETMKMLLRPFKGSRDLIDILNQAIEQQQLQQPAQDQPQPPSQEQEMAGQQARMQAAKAQIDLQARQQDMQLRQEKHAVDMARAQQDMALQREKMLLQTARSSAPPPPHI
ncbi:hypothetical protein FPY71_11605 [Aureimonas fodinaquatilis]|uniref:Uncharacterized protein n=1 Tax=Aureimonas fodinaquatilis TaxID=2565783 RepID=A0A5B0DWF3_9HYPH|nr:hypothetical protein [Aureimonas fodinaquatilis]KAA0971084.1 hypothetical protein FPY71_11605 [Aureimonas fodinaquatilis]